LRAAGKLNAPEDYLHAIEKQLAELPLLSLSSFHLGNDELVHSTIGVCADEDRAREDCDRLNIQLAGMWSRMDKVPERDKALMMKDKSSTLVKREGNVVIVERRYDREHIELIRQRREREKGVGEEKKQAQVQQ